MNHFDNKPFDNKHFIKKDFKKNTDRPRRASLRGMAVLLAAVLLLSAPCAASASAGDFGVNADTDSRAVVSVLSDDTEVTATEPSLKDGVYQITSVEELFWFAEAVNAGSTSIDAVLCNDITVNADLLTESGEPASGLASDYINWTSAGSAGQPYTGSFDGNGYTISGLYERGLTATHLGLFGMLGEGASVTDLTIADSYFYGASYVGALAGRSSGALVSGCVNESVVKGDYYAAGLIGMAGDSTITLCYNSGTISSTGDYTGGITGYNTGGEITYCYNTGSISTDRDYTGGIAGYNDEDAVITNCYNTGSVRSESDDVYSICGDNKGTVETCYYLENTAYSMEDEAYMLDPDAGSKTEDQFASGKVTYQLNNSSSENVVYYQTIGTDTYPVLDASHGIVYKLSATEFSNTPKASDETSSGSTTSSKSSASSGSNTSASSPAEKGTVIKQGKITYVVLSQSAQTVSVKTVKKSAKKVIIPSTITYEGYTYSVTRIANNAMKNCKKLVSVTIGANVSQIGKKAFYGDKKLKTVIFAGRRVQTIKSKAFKGTAAKIKVKATSTKMLTYKKLLKKAGISKKAKYIKT